jgi:hypothetical protein
MRLLPILNGEKNWPEDAWSDCENLSNMESKMAKIAKLTDRDKSVLKDYFEALAVYHGVTAPAVSSCDICWAQRANETLKVISNPDRFSLLVCSSCFEKSREPELQEEEPQEEEDRWDLI